MSNSINSTKAEKWLRDNPLAVHSEAYQLIGELVSENNRYRSALDNVASCTGLINSSWHWMNDISVQAEKALFDR